MKIARLRGELFLSLFVILLYLFIIQMEVIMFKLLSVLVMLLMLAINGLAQWTRIETSPDQVVLDITEDNGVLYIGVNRTGAFKSTDHGETWDPINSGLVELEARSIYKILISGDTLWAATDDGIYRSENGGENWNKRSNGIPVAGGALFEHTQSLFDYNGSLFTGAWTGIYKSDDRGENWYPVNTETSGVGPRHFMEHHGILFAARESNNTPYAYRSTTNGESWTPYNTLGFPSFSFYSDGDNLWCGSIVGVWLSTDDGQTWEQKNEGLPPDPYNSCVLRLNGYMITSQQVAFDSAVFVSSDEGEHWENFSEGIESVYHVEKLFVHENFLLAGTNDGLFRRDTAITVPNAVDPVVQTPESPQLLESYPNPFNATTTLAYHLPASGLVSLRIFDLLGREVAVLKDGFVSSGNYQATFNGDNLSSGIYFARLEAGAFSQTMKMVLLK
jgi:photosystem II stability/assembly factor-like uncharacterized protein